MNTKDKATNPYMSTAKDKLANLKSELEIAVENRNIHLNRYNKALNICDEFEDEIKALEEALAPKQGDVYKNVNTSLEYILARVAYRKYCLINLLTGERYMDGVENMDEIFGCHIGNFVKVRG